MVVGPLRRYETLGPSVTRTCVNTPQSDHACGITDSIQLTPELPDEVMLRMFLQSFQRRRARCSARAAGSQLIRRATSMLVMSVLLGNTARGRSWEETQRHMGATPRLRSIRPSNP